MKQKKVISAIMAMVLLGRVYPLSHDSWGTVVSAEAEEQGSDMLAENDSDNEDDNSKDTYQLRINDGIVYKVYSNMASVIALSSPDDEELVDLVIPDNVFDVPVTEIESEAFYDCNISSVKFGNNLKAIGDSAFAFNDELKEIDLPDDLETIGEKAFFYCKGMEKIIFNDKLVSLGESAFTNCFSLTSVELPDSINSIGKSAFMGCDALASVKLSDTLSRIEDYTFSGCDSLTEINFGSSLEYIGNRAFAYCDQLTGIKLGEKMTAIGKEVFPDKNIDCFEIPAGIKELDGCPMYYKEKDGIAQDIIIKIMSPECVLNINNTNWSYYIIVSEENSAAQKFAEENNIRFCTLEQYENDGYKKTEFSYFDENASLRECGLSYVKINGGAELSKVSRFDNGLLDIPDEVEGIPVISIDSEALNKVPYDLKSEMRTLKIGKNIRSINEGTFRKCENVKTVVIGEGVETIGDSAFECCYKLKDITFNEGLKEICANAFNDCMSIEEVKLPNGLESLGESAFERCGRLEKINIPEQLTRIEPYTFCGTYIEEIVFPDNIEYIADKAFSTSSKYYTERITGHRRYRYEEVKNENGTVWVKTIPISPTIESTSGTTPDISSVTILNPECEIAEYAFNGVLHLYGYAESTAYIYAINNDIDFVELENSGNEYLHGDTNCDGTVDMSDAVLIMQALANPNKYGIGGTDEKALTEQGAKNGDVDKDVTGLTSNDALKIQEFLLGIVESL